MLSFKELQEKKSKIKINPKKEDVMEGSCGSYSKGGEVKKNHGEDCDCQKCEKKRRKEDLGDEKTVSTEELAYDSQEKVSEEGNQEIAETEIKNLLTFDELQYAKTLNEEQLQEFLKGLFGGGKPTSSSSGQMPNHSGLASKLGQRRQMLNKAMGKTDTKVLGFSKGGKVKKEEVEELEETKLGDTAYARARDAGAQRRRTKEYKQGLNRSTTRKEKGMYRLATAQRRTDADLERQKTTYDTGAHKGDYDRAKRAKEYKKEEVEQINEIGGIMKAMKAAGGGSGGMARMGQSGNPMSGSSSGGSTSTPGGGTGGASSAPMNASMAALKLSKGGKVKKKSYKESLEIFEKKKELSIDDQMKISREYNRKSPEEKKAANKKAVAGIPKGKPKKDTRTDAQKMTDATGPRPGSRYRGD